MKRSFFAFCLIVFSWMLLPVGSLRSQTASSSVPFQICGVWTHPGFFGTDEKEAAKKIRTTLDDYVRSGINTVMVMIKGTNGYVYYQSRMGPKDPAYSWDFFGVFLKEAQKRRITVHPWFCVFPEGAMAGQVRQHPEWLIRSAENEIVGVVNPALPEVRAYEIGLMIELVKKYPVDWVHLDYIRFPSSPREVYFSWDGRTRAQFKEYSGLDPADIKARDSGNMMWDEWIAWNGERVTQFVKELKDALKSVGRPVKISAAVFPAADKAKVLIGQDWESWAKQGLVDMLCPMLYTNHAGFFEKYAREAADIGKGKCLVCPGLGIGTSHNKNTPQGLREQIGISNKLGCDGVIFFSSSSLTADFLEKLGESRAAASRVSK